MTYDNAFQRILAQHSAPTLLGVKCANLVSLDAVQQEVALAASQFNRLACKRGLRSRILCQCRRRTLLLVYNVAQLGERLRQPDVQSMLRQWGYRDFTVRACLDRLSERMRANGEFPHEIGIFLGYPMEDVIGFIENRGENYKFCGCWKVYGSEQSARKMFASYDQCRHDLCHKMNEGRDLYQALRLM